MKVNTKINWRDISIFTANKQYLIIQSHSYAQEVRNTKSRPRVGSITNSNEFHMS